MGLMSVAFFVYVFNWKNASSPSSIHHRNHHLSGRNNHLHQNRRFGERSAGMDHLAHSYRNQNDHEDETSYEEDEDVERRRADLAEEGGGERSDSRNNNNNNFSEDEEQPKVFLVPGTAGFVGYHVATKLK